MANDISTEPEVGSTLVSELSPEDQQAIFSQLQIPEASPALESAQDPVDTLDPKDLAELSIQTKGEWDPVAWAKSHKGAMQDPATAAKVADTFALLRDRGFKFKDINLGKAAKSLWEIIPGMAKWAGSALELGIVNPSVNAQAVWTVPAENLFRDVPVVGSVLKAITPLDTKSQQEFEAIRSKKSAELVASTEAGVGGLFGLVKKTGSKVSNLVKKGFNKAGLSPEVLPDYLNSPPTERVNALWDAVGDADYRDNVLKGRGIATQALLGGVIKDAEATGAVVDPEAVATMAAGDPVSFLAFPGGFKVVTAGGKTLVKLASRASTVELVTAVRAAQRASARAARVEKAAVTNLEKIKAIPASSTPMGAPILTEAGSLASAASRAAAIADEAAVRAAANLVQAGPVARTLGSVFEAAGKIVQPIRETSSAIGNALDVGARKTLGAAGITTSAALRTTAALTEFGTSFLPPMATPRIFRAAAAKLGNLGEATSEAAGNVWSGNMAAVPNGLRLLTDVTRGIPTVAQGAAKGFIMLDVPLAAATSETPADTAHMPIFGTFFGSLGAIPRAGNRIVQGQLIADRAWGNLSPMSDYRAISGLDAAHKFSMEAANDPAKNQWLSAIRDFLKPTGAQLYWVSDAKMMEDAARRYSPGASEEWYASLPSQRAVTLKNVITDAGTPVNVILLRDADAAPHEAFHPFQDVLGESAMRVIDDLVYNEYASYWDQIGRNYARQFYGSEKFARDYLANGEDWHEAVLDASRGGNKEWRKDEWPGQIEKAANQYLSRELSAEMGDAIMRNSGPSLLGNNSVPGRIARIIGKTLVGFGVEPFAGARTEGQGIPLRFDPAEKMREALQGSIESLKIEQKRPNLQAIPPYGMKIPPKISEVPGGPTVPGVPKPPPGAGERGKEAEGLIPSTPEAPVSPGWMSPRDIMVVLSKIIATGDGARIDYHSAPGEPAGVVTSTRVDRRSAIEAYRNMPNEVRPLFEKLFFADRVIRTKGGKTQILGWSSDAFVANAGKLAESLTEAGVELSLYPVDAATKSFTRDGWKQLYADVNQFVLNQQAGQTGSGLPLVTPKEVQARGFFPPEEHGKPAGPLDQDRADIINYLFGIPIPSTPRIGEVFPRNLAGQAVSEATAPGRVSELVTPRAPFSGERAKTMRIEGQNLKEVNPFRASLEKLGIKPDLIEVMQRLNLERISKIEIAPEAPQLRGVEFTLQAGFQPGKDMVGDIILKVREASAEDLKDQTKFPGGATGVAYDLGARLTDPSQLRTLQNERDAYIDETRALSKAGNFDAGYTTGTKAQFFREAIEAATGTGSAGIRLRSKGQTKFALEGAQFQGARTEAGKTVEDRGFELVETRDPMTNMRVLTFHDTGDYRDAGSIEYYVNGEKGAHVSSVLVPGDYREQGHASALYREMLDRLQSEGITDVSGSVVSAVPMNIRRNLLGEPGLGSDSGTKLFGRSVNFVTNKIPPKGEIQFQPGNKMGLPQPVEDRVKEIYGMLRDSADALRELTDSSTLSERDSAVEGLGRAAEYLDNLDLNYRATQFPALDQVRRAIETSRNDLQDLLNEGRAASAEDAPIVQQVADEMVYVLKGAQRPEGGQFQPGQQPEDKPLFLMAKAPELPAFDRAKIDGGSSSIPSRTYPEADKAGGNPWIRRSVDPARSLDASNADRVLMVQMSSDLINSNAPVGTSDVSGSYYDKLYSGAREGYARLADFWEIPQWIGYGAKNFPNADVYVVRDMAKAKQFLDEAGYGKVLFSALEVNKNLIKDLISDYKGNVEIGGYVDPKTFNDHPTATWHDSFKSLVEDSGVEYKDGVDYRHFAGSDVIPRLTMSTGCKHKCAFCTVTKELVTTPPQTVEQQVEAISELGAKLVYLNDKTFGQAPNYKTLTDVNKRMQEANPDFKGFIVQTTASQMTKIPADWLKESGIKFVELGIETYNDPILKDMHKPATTALIDRATQALREAGIALIPNIMVGLPGETAESYANTLDFLKRNADIISHANIYNLALYKNTELGKKLTTATEADFNENVMEKSFYTDPEVHRVFAGKLYGMASEMLSGKPSSAKFQPEKYKGYRAGEYWVGNGELNHAPEGHYEWALEKFGKENEPVVEAEKAGYSRVIVSERAVYVDPSDRKTKWNDLSRSERQKIEDLAFEKNLPVIYWNTEVIPQPRPGESDFQPGRDPAADGIPTIDSMDEIWSKSYGEGNRDLLRTRVLAPYGAGNNRDLQRTHRELLRTQVPAPYGAGNNRDLQRTHRELLRTRVLAPYGEGNRRQREPGGGRFQPNNDFAREIEDIRDARSPGQTFTREGDVWRVPVSAPVDLVTLASANIPRKELSIETFQKAIEKFSDLLNDPRIVTGIYAFDKGPNATASIDVNAVVPQKFRENTLAFAKANNQIAIWDANHGEEVRTGGTGETVLRDVEQIKQVLGDLTEGKPIQFSPRKAKKGEADPFKFNAGSGGFVKAWLLPNGQPEQLGGQWHDAWLRDNAEEVSKRWNIPLKEAQSTSETDSREAALKAGFSRINYSTGSGEITIELRKSDLRKQKDGIFQIVDSNATSIDKISVHLFDDGLKKVVASDSEPVFRLEDQEKAQNIPFVTKFQPAKSGHGETEGLPGLDVGRESLSPRTRSQMTRNDMRQHFPEAVVPRANDESLPSKITESPLFKKSGSEKEAVEAFAKRLVKFARDYENDPAFKAGLKWYEEFTPILKRQFGKDAQLMAELLAATSPNTSVEVNYGYALDALESLRRGRFDKIIPKFNEGLEKMADGSWESWIGKQIGKNKVENVPASPSPATFLAHWIDTFNLKPTQSNGRLYGQHSIPVLQVFARRWMELNTGPKTRNFVENLIGKSEEATIDIWADRTMRWAGYEGHVDRWRILPENVSSVIDADFSFAQKAFRRAAEEFGVKPSAFQGALWFAEKQRWADNGWSRLDLGDFRREISKTEIMQQGVGQRLRISQSAKKPGVQGEIPFAVESKRGKVSYGK